MYYLRIFRTSYSAHTKWNLKPRFNELILDADDVFEITKSQVRMDVVNLESGKVARHDYEMPLPEWLKEPCSRAIASASRQFPQTQKG